jgi:hypothetical protein
VAGHGRAVFSGAVAGHGRAVFSGAVAGHGRAVFSGAVAGHGHGSTPPAPTTAFAAALPAPSGGDVTYGIAQVRITRRRLPPGATHTGQLVFAGRVGGLAVAVRSRQWSALRASTRAYVVATRVAGQSAPVRNLALLIVRRRVGGTAASQLGEFVVSVANATPAVGSFWVRGVDRHGLARIFTVRDMLATAVANWGRYVRVLRAMDALSAAAHPFLAKLPARSVRGRTGAGAAGVWTGGPRPTRRERVIFRLLMDALGNPLEYAAVKRNPLVAQFIAHELGNPGLARRWREITRRLPLEVPDRYAAAAQEEQQFTSIAAPRIAPTQVTISDDANSSSQLGHDDPNLDTTLAVQLQGSGAGRVTGSEEVYGPNIDCGAQCQATFANGPTYETLTAMPGSRSAFSRWSGCDQVLPSGACKVLVGARNRTVTAYFNLAHSLQVILTGPAVGRQDVSVTSDTGGIDCNSQAPCVAVFTPGQDVKLTEFHNEDSYFGGWYGCDQVSSVDVAIYESNTCTVEIPAGGRQVYADFELANTPPPGPAPADEPPLAAFTVSPNPALPANAVTVDGSGSSDPDGQITDYTWIVSDGTFVDAGENPRSELTFRCYGMLTVTLRVTDTDGQKAAASQDLTIDAAPGYRRCGVGGSPAIVRAAGNGTPCQDAPWCGDDGLATDAQLSFPAAVATDAAGNVYIADTSDQEVREVAPDGTITRFAGTGSTCFTATCGDGGPASNAPLDNPEGVAVDANGDVYIADTGDQEVRKVAPDGIISRIAGIHGDSCTSAPDCGDGGPATSARLDQPLGVAVDSAGNLYIADAGDHEVRKVAPDGTITRFAGTGMRCTSAPDCGDGSAAVLAQLNTPQGVAADVAGNVYIADTGDNEIRKVATDGTISRFAGNGKPCQIVAGCGDGGSAQDARLNSPASVAVDSTANVYIADSGDNEIRLVKPSDGSIEQVAGTGTPCTTAPACGDAGKAISAQLNFPQGVAVDPAGNIDIADTRDHEVRQVAP